MMALMGQVVAPRSLKYRMAGNRDCPESVAHALPPIDRRGL